jgi:hypothetical protein
MQALCLQQDAEGEALKAEARKPFFGLHQNSNLKKNTGRQTGKFQHGMA